MILALQSGRIDVYVRARTRRLAYKAAVSPEDFKVVGTLNGGWPDDRADRRRHPQGQRPGRRPITAALNHAFEDGTYTEVLERWGLQDEAIEQSETNPPGLPKTD